MTPFVRRQSSTEAEHCRRSLRDLVVMEQDHHRHHREALRQILQTDNWQGHEILGAILKQKPSKIPFLCKDQWEELFSIALVKHLVNCDDAAADDIRQNHIRVLAILVYIGAFRSIKNILGSHKDRVRDEFLPFTNDDLPLSFVKQENHLFDDFKREQHVFCPVVIRETEHQDHVKARRLPFRKMALLGGGAYGAVFSVEIPAHHFYPADQDVPLMQPKCFAVKVFRDSKDFQRERELLERLKAPNAKHDHIMLHQATMSYRDNYLVLLPLAEFGDLRQFLYGKRSTMLSPNESHSLVDFLRLDVSERKSIQLALMKECVNVADALHWLHEGRGLAQDYIYAHLDLKPDNILLTKRTGFPVGSWKLADFSLAVCPRHAESSGRNADNWHSRRPLPRPQPGDYSAPEIDLRINQLVGLLSDVWSFVCILAEVLTLALTNRNQVKEFYEQRNHGEDHAFYIIRQSTELALTSQASQYAAVKPEVDAWLERLCKCEAQNRWIISFTSIIRKFLDPCPKSRPSSKALLEDLQHAVRHFEDNSPDAYLECQGSLKVQNLRPSSKPANDPLPGITPLTLMSPGVSVSSISPHGDVDAPLNISSLSLGEGRTSMPSPRVVSTLSNYKVSEQSSILRLEDGVRGKAKSVAISCTGKTVGWLFVNSKPVDSESASVQILTLENDPSLDSSRDPETDYWNWRLVAFDLAPRSPWRHIAIAGQYLLVWTSLKNQTVSVYSRNIASKRPLPLPDSLSLSGFLNKVAISPKGIAIFVCADKLKIWQLTSSSDNLGGNPLMPSKNHYFCDAVCNDQGDYVYAWSYAEDGSHLLYTCAVDLQNNVQVLYTHRYNVTLPRQQQIKLTPYARYDGCIVQDECKNFFPSQAKPDPPVAPTTPLRRPFDKEIPAALISKIYSNRSLLVVENLSTWPRLRRPKLWLVEYPIEVEDRSGHNFRIIGQGKLLYRLQGEVNGDSRIGIMEDDVRSGTVIIVVCNTDSTYEAVKLVQNS